MVAPPELEKMEVDTPPPSPTLVYHSINTCSTQEIASPTKRVKSRGVRVGPPKKRRKEDTTDHRSQHKPDEAALQPSCNNEECPRPHEVPVDGYTQYIAAVSGRLAGFYPLSDEIYIVQGWDDNSHYVKVSMDLVYQQTRLTSL